MIPQAILDAWPNCATPNCKNKVCTWGSDSLCYPHEERIVGKAEMDRRYNATHERPIDQIKDGETNLMTKDFAAIEAEAEEIRRAK